MRPKLHIVICSTRPGRVGPSVARWFADLVEPHGKFEPVLIDLAEFNLPIFDEPKHPRLQQYEHEHTKRWSASVASADAFVFVTPEYNHGPPPSFVNAMNYLFHEWQYKPAGFVSYGGVSGGLRSAHIEKLTLLALKVPAMVEAVTIHMIAQHVSGGEFKAQDAHGASAKAMLDELIRWTEALKPLRQKAA